MNGQPIYVSVVCAAYVGHSYSHYGVTSAHDQVRVVHWLLLHLGMQQADHKDFLSSDDQC